MPPHPSPYAPEFSLAEQWLIHAVMLTRLGFGSDHPPSTDPYVCDLAIVDKLESTAPSFNRAELERIRDICLDFADREITDEADRALALDVVERVHSHLHSTPARAH